MAEQPPGVVNKKLLIVALAIAAVVVILYNVQIARIRQAGKGKTVKLLRVRHDLQPGEKIGEKDIEVVEVDADIAKGLGNVLTADKLDYAVTSTINQSIPMGRWLLFEHTISRGANNPSSRIQPGWVTHTFAIDPRQSPGEILRIGDRVNVLGMLAVNNKPLQAYRIIANLKVMEIGGKSYRETVGATGARSAGSEGSRQYQKITVEVPQEVSLQLPNVLTHVRGSLWIEVRNPTAIDRGGRSPEVVPELRNLAAAPRGG